MWLVLRVIRPRRSGPPSPACVAVSHRGVAVHARRRRPAAVDADDQVVHEVAVAAHAVVLQDARRSCALIMIGSWKSWNVNPFEWW